MISYLKLIALFGLGFFVTSCSTYDRVAVWYKYRNDFRAHKVDQDILVTKAKPTQTSTAQSDTTNEVPILASNRATTIPETRTAIENEATAIARAFSTKSAESATALTHSTAKPEKLTLRQAWKLKKEFKKSAQAPQEGGKSQLLATLLCFFFGLLGIHRFYLGYIWQGVVQLLTLGCCGVWALIDLIRILTGDLQPNGGKYERTLNDL